jgi:hypothetical protein
MYELFDNKNHSQNKQDNIDFTRLGFSITFPKRTGLGQNVHCQKNDKCDVIYHINIKKLVDTGPFEMQEHEQNRVFQQMPQFV